MKVIFSFALAAWRGKVLVWNLDIELKATMKQSPGRSISACLYLGSSRLWALFFGEDDGQKIHR